MDYAREIEKWQCKLDALVSTGDEAEAETVRDHLVRLRSLNGEPEPDTRRDWHKDLTTWQRKRETLQADAAMYRSKGAPALHRNALADLAAMDRHIERLEELASRA